MGKGNQDDLMLLIDSDSQEITSDSDSDSDSDDNYHVYGMTCILELIIKVNEGYEPTYELRAVPYVSRDDVLEDLDNNASGFFTNEHRAFFDSFRTNDSNILNLLTSIMTDRKRIIDGKCYRFSIAAALISGFGSDAVLSSSCKRFQNKAENSPNFRIDRIFFSYVDLLIRNRLNLDIHNLEEQLTYQKITYGLELSEGEKQDIIRRLESHPLLQRKRELEKVKTLWPSLDKDVSKPLFFVDYLPTLIDWLTEKLAHLWLSSEPGQDMELVVENAEEYNQERLGLIARLRADNYPSLAAQKQDLKRLIHLRSYYQHDETYYYRLAYVNHLTQQFWQAIDSPTCWQDPAIIRQVRKIMLENLLLSDEILANMDDFIRQSGVEPTAQRVAFLLTHQNLSFCYTFIYSGLIDFYARYREKGWSEVLPYCFINGKPAKGFYASKSTVTNALFFKEGTTENELRKLYNTFIKTGFYKKYGKEKNGQNDFKTYLSHFDNRFVIWTPLDSVIPTSSVYTYSHPIHDTRPT